MKRALLAVAQFLLFLIAFAAGSFFPPLHLRQVLAATPDGARVFVWDGVLIATLLLLLVLIVEQLRRRIKSAAPWTLAAYVLALAAGLALKFGFMTV